jgi:hypothetical protein
MCSGRAGLPSKVPGPGPKQSLPGEKRVDFYPVFINPKPGFFRGWFKGKVDRQLQEKAEKALEPIKDLTLVMK